MQSKEPTVVLAAEESDADLWSIQPFIQQCGISVVSLFSGDELLTGLEEHSIEPTVVLLSATCTNGRVSDTISRIKEMDHDIPVVIATNKNDCELEREVRCAGIFYYLTLPAERDEIEQVILSALRAGKRH